MVNEEERLRKLLDEKFNEVEALKKVCNKKYEDYEREIKELKAEQFSIKSQLEVVKHKEAVLQRGLGLSCPVCKAQPVLGFHEDYSKWGDETLVFYTYCEKCGLTVNSRSDTVREAIWAWNSIEVCKDGNESMS